MYLVNDSTKNNNDNNNNNEQTPNSLGVARKQRGGHARDRAHHGVAEGPLPRAYNHYINTSIKV